MSKMIDDGGPAFPGQPCGSDGLPQQQAFNGMSLRDWFAGQVLKGLISYNGDYGDDALRAVVHVCFSWADAMLAERQKEKKP